ncbi:MAG: ribosome maturation factor RimP [Legionellaceae bacterium]|nr:ribosome maturation factor RimP [Legionellaceae bacterium]
MIQQDIEQLVRPSIEAMGIELWGIEYQRQGRSGLLRIYIDKPEGVVVDDCQRVSYQVSAVLDVNDPIPGQYQLEISSPGMPRPLFYAEQYTRYLGDEVQIRLNVPLDGRRNIVGIIQAVEGDALFLVEGDIKHTFLFSNIIKAHLTGERGEA